MMRAVGYGDDDFKQPLVGVAHAWIEIMPCNFNHREQAEWVKEGIREAGGTPVEMNTIAISDGIAMGTEGMKASLVSREVVADSIELVTRGHLLDALVCISGCDKTIPGMVMALARLDLPGLMVYGGSIMPGRFGHGDRRLDERGAASARVRAGGGDAARAPGLRRHQRADAAPRGHEAVGPFHRGRHGPGRRDHARAPAPRRGEGPQRARDDRHGKDDRRRGPRGEGDARPGGGAAAREPDREKRRHDDPQGLARAGWRGHEGR